LITDTNDVGTIADALFTDTNDVVTITDALLTDTNDVGAITDALDEAATDAVALGDVAIPTATSNPSVQGDATACTEGSACASKRCVDGVCCDSACEGACEGACESCALPASPGVCALAPFGVDPRGDCIDASHGVGAAICAGNQGTCSTGEEQIFDCREYACLPAFGACASTCADSTACAPGFTCDGDGHRIATAASSPSGCNWSVQPRNPADRAIDLTLAITVAASVAGRVRRRSARG
jgi:hypothetical protein